MRAALLVSILVATACSKPADEPPAVPLTPSAINAAMKVLADRACACKRDPACEKYVRSDWDAQKKPWLEASKSFIVGNKISFDSQMQTMFGCAELADVTFRREP